jgi:hypothetical protein
VEASTRRRLILLGICFCVLSLVETAAFPQGNGTKTYPLRGTIVAAKVAERSETTPVYTDPQGKTQGGTSYVRRLPVFRIETDDKFYELEGKKRQVLILGDAIQFRLEKEWAYVQQGYKEQKFRVMAVELKPKAPSSN